MKIFTCLKFRHALQLNVQKVQNVTNFYSKSIKRETLKKLLLRKRRNEFYEVLQ